MASAGQPLKKRKFYEPSQQQSPPPAPPSAPPPPQPPPPPPFQSPAHSPEQPPSQEEILTRRRNQEEIRNVYECYKRIKYCVSLKDVSSMTGLEQAYLSLITASRGCTSVQRIVADFIPKFASYCPTALEAAVKVLINMHNWSLAVITKAENTDHVAFDTAKACIFGLADICQAAASEAPTSSVIQGICAAVIRNVLTFLICSFEEKDIFQFLHKGILKTPDPIAFASVYLQNFLDEDVPTLSKLSIFRALSFLRILFICPKNSVTSCFELFDSNATKDSHKQGQYILRQLATAINEAVAPVDINYVTRSSIAESCKGDIIMDDGTVTDGGCVPASHVKRDCLFGLILHKDPSLRNWILSRYKKLLKSASAQVVSDITAFLEELFGYFGEHVEAEGNQLDGDEDDLGQPKYITQYLLPRVSSHNGISIGQQEPSPESTKDKFSVSSLRNNSSVVSMATDYGPNAAPASESQSRSMTYDSGEPVDFSRPRSSMPRELPNRQILSPRNRTPPDLRTSGGRDHIVPVEADQIPKVDLSLPASVSTSFVSPKHSLLPCQSSANQVIRYSDGDPAALDIFSASKLLWLGSLGPDVSEAAVRHHFEKFGYMDHLQHFPFKGFSLIEYRYIMDAVKARRVIRGHSPWGGNVQIKFFDKGLENWGPASGVAVGSSCHVYVGNVPSQWEKDEVISETRKVVFRGPCMVTDLTSECALLVEFETPQEAAIAMAHLRQHRMGKTNTFLPLNVGSASMPFHSDGIKPASSAANVGTGSNRSDKGMIASLHPKPVLKCQSEAHASRTSRLSLLFFQLRTKYSIGNNTVSPNFQVIPGRAEQFPTSTLFINIPNSNPSFVTDDELFNICNLAAENVGFIVKLTRANKSTGPCWFVECNSIDTATTLLRDLRDCPGGFFQIEFSHPGKHHGGPHLFRPESSTPELSSPNKINLGSHGVVSQSGHAFQSNWTPVGSQSMGDSRAGKGDTIFSDVSLRGSPVVAGSADQIWIYRNPDSEQHTGAGINCGPISTQGPTPIMTPPLQGPIAPPRSVQVSPFMQPNYFPPSSPWGVRAVNHNLSLHPSSPGAAPNGVRHNIVAPPFIPPSVTPLAQMQGSPVPPLGHMYSVPVAPPRLTSIPPLQGFRPPRPLPQPDFIPPLPPNPPPPPCPQPPVAPPPPSSPPPPLPSEASLSEISVHCTRYSWQGTLSKSGVHFCTIYAQRVDSDGCKYSNAVAEPMEWPAKLDMTKRTDFQHVKSAFSSTPTHKREICRLLPSSQDDHKGFQDFISYLKQRECAGVIKIPAGRSMWPRLIFILPQSPMICSMLSVAPDPSICLIAVILPKETNCEWT